MSLQRKAATNPLLSGKSRIETLVQEKLDKITKEDLPRWEKQLFKKGTEDTYTLYLKAKKYEIDMLKEEIEAFQNPEMHFTKQYRTYEGHCSKLQTDLDRMDIFGRNDLKPDRKVLYVSLDEMIKALASKAHVSGEICRNCEIQT